MVAQPSTERSRARRRSRILIVGSGDVAARVIPRLARHARVFALVRTPAAAPAIRALGAIPLAGDLDRPASLRRLAGLAPTVLHFAPPPERDDGDPRTRNLIAALGMRSEKPQRIVYISTSGVYGDCRGERVAETRPLHPATARARRRVDAESRLRRFARRNRIRLAILRAPGIYAGERLSLARLERADPVLEPARDVFTNHVHADDLARLAIAAITRGKPCRSYNANDGSELRMGEYYDLMADLFDLPRPPRADPDEIARTLSPMMRSFMSESRRLDNARILRELRIRLLYPTVAHGLAAIRARWPLPNR